MFFAFICSFILIIVMPTILVVFFLELYSLLLVAALVEMRTRVGSKWGNVESVGTSNIGSLGC